MKRISCVIFDLDGTLADTSELIYASFNHIADKYLHTVFTPKEIVAMYGPPEDVAIRKIIADGQADEAIDDFCEYYEANLLRLADTYKGIRELLGFLKSEGIILALFTGKGKRTTLITLDKMEVKKYFDLVITGNDVEKYKPSGDGIRKVLKAFMLQPKETLMVGDSESDVKAAKESGVTMIAALWDSYAKEEVLRMNPEYTFDTVEELANWMREGRA